MRIVMFGALAATALLLSGLPGLAATLAPTTMTIMRIEPTPPRDLSSFLRNDFAAREVSNEPSSASKIGGSRKRHRR